MTHDSFKNLLTEGIHANLGNVIGHLIDLFENESNKDNFLLLPIETRNGCVMMKGLEFKSDRQCYLTIIDNGPALSDEAHNYSIRVTETEDRHIHYSISLRGRLMDEQFTKMHTLFSALVDEKISQRVVKKLQSLILRKEDHVRIYEMIEKL